MKMMHEISHEWEGYSKADRQTRKRMTEKKWSWQKVPGLDKYAEYGDWDWGEDEKTYERVLRIHP